MEHRYSQRVPLNINTLIYKRGVPVAMGRIKNGSGHGLYLETDYQEIRALQKLELEVLLGQRPKTKEGRQGRGHYQISALVVRKSDFGYGLEMEVLDDAGSHKLRELIQQQKAPRLNLDAQSLKRNQNLVTDSVGLQKYNTHTHGPSISPRS